MVDVGKYTVPPIDVVGHILLYVCIKNGKSNTRFGFDPAKNEEFFRNFNGFNNWLQPTWMVLKPCHIWNKLPTSTGERRISEPSAVCMFIYVLLLSTFFLICGFSFSKPTASMCSIFPYSYHKSPPFM